MDEKKDEDMDVAEDLYVAKDLYEDDEVETGIRRQVRGPCATDGVPVEAQSARVPALLDGADAGEFHALEGG